MKRVETDREGHREKRVVVTVFLISFMLAVLLISPFIGSSITHNKSTLTYKKLRLALSIDFWNSRYYYFLGSISFYDKSRTNFDESIRYFRKALKLNPYHLYTWFSLAKAHWMKGDIGTAGIIFDRLAEENTMNRNVAWDAGIFLLTREERSRAFKHLRRYLLLKPEDYGNVFSICIEAGIGYETISQELLGRDPALLDMYYTYLMKNNLIDVLDRTLDIAVLAENQDRVKLMVCNSLIGAGYFKKAQEVWAVIHEREFTGGIINGGFEEEMTNGCFDWSMYKGTGRMTSTDVTVKHSGIRSSNISFDGSFNVGGFLISQIIPVDSGREYHIRAYAKAENISTSNGPYIDVRGYKCTMTRSRSDSMTGSEDWKEIYIQFMVPEECEAVLVSIVRDKSHKLNNKISGRVWLDDISMEKLN